jgi:hypothetical protein
MAARFIPVAGLRGLVQDLAKVGEALQDRAEKIAGETLETSPMAQKYPNRYGKVEVSTPRPGARRVAAQGPMAHLDEFGSANNPPHAAMRRAAERHGRFVEEQR